MKRLIALLLCCLVWMPSVAAQKRKKPVPKRPATPITESVAPRITGSSVTIVDKNGNEMRGQVLDINAYSVKITSAGLVSTLALETIFSITFGASAQEPTKPAASAPHPDFLRELDTVMRTVQAISTATKASPDYTNYGNLLIDLRRQSERFINKYSSTEKATEAMAVALVGGVVTDYTWARMVWTLKLGSTATSSVTENDSPVVADAFALYPELRASADSSNRVAPDLIIGTLWKKAGVKIERLRLSQTKN